MGIDLTVVPIDYHTLDWWLGYNRLKLERDYDLWDHLRLVLKPKPLPENITFDWYGDEGLEKQTTNPYGEKLVYVNALAFHKLVGFKTTKWNTAVLLFLSSLPKDIPIILWWH